MKKVVEIVKEKDKKPEEDNTPILGNQPLSFKEEYEKLIKDAPTPKPPTSGIDQLDAAFRRAFRYKPKQN